MKLVAKALIFDLGGKVLVLRRSGSHPRYAHHFDLPGGEVEQGEDPATAVAREIKEETGLGVDSSSLELCFRNDLPNSLTHLLFKVTCGDGEPKLTLSWEHDGYDWLAVDDLLAQPLPPNVDSYYHDVIKWLGQAR